MPNDPPLEPATPPDRHRAEDVRLEALAPVDIQEVIGLCELVQEQGGRVDFYELVRDSGYLQLILLAAEGARILGLAHIREGVVTLTPLARAWLQGDSKERRRVLQDQIAGLRLTRWICERLRFANGSLPEVGLLNELAALLPPPETSSTFRTLLNWASYAQILRYDEDGRTVSLEQIVQAPMCECTPVVE